MWWVCFLKPGNNGIPVTSTNDLHRRLESRVDRHVTCRRRPIFAAANLKNRLQAKSNRQALRLETGSFWPELRMAGLCRIDHRALRNGV
jgi:hypothetical protein